MADVGVTQPITPFTPVVNRYLLEDASGASTVAPPQGKRTLLVEIDLNGGTLTYDFQGRAAGSGLAYGAIQGTPLSTGTPATSGTATQIWRFDATGIEVAINVTVATGSPKISWRMHPG